MKQPFLAALIFAAPLCVAQSTVSCVFNPPVRKSSLLESKPGFWSFGDPCDPKPLRSNREIFRDKTFWATELFAAGAAVFDVEATHHCLGRLGCREMNGENQGASLGMLYRHAAPDFIVGIGLNYLMMRYVSKSLTLVHPSIAGAIHLRRGIRALRDD